MVTATESALVYHEVVTHNDVIIPVLQVDGPDLLDSSGKKKTQRCKRLARPEKDKAFKNKRRKNEEDEKTTLLSSSSEPLTTHITQVDLLQSELTE